MLCDLKIQFERHMNEGKYHLAEQLVTAISALNRTEGLYRYRCGSDPSAGPLSSDVLTVHFANRKAQVLKALNRSTAAYGVLQRLQVHCEKTKNTEVVVRYRLTHPSPTSRCFS